MSGSGGPWVSLRDASVVAHLDGGRDAPIQTGSRSLVAWARFDLRRDVVEEAARRGAECAERFEGRRAEGDAGCEAWILKSHYALPRQRRRILLERQWHANGWVRRYEWTVMESIQNTFIQNSILNTFLSIQKWILFKRKYSVFEYFLF